MLEDVFLQVRIIELMDSIQNLRSEHDFHHTLDDKFLPRGESSVKTLVVRMFKHDELFIDFELL